MTWELEADDLLPIAIGAAVLGTGGGGNPYLGMLRARELMRRGLSMGVVDPDELPDDAFLVTAGGMGSPVVSHEKLPGGNEEALAVRALESYLGRTIDVVAPMEMGGSNSMVALVVGALLDVPVLDGDGMGRAFPELQMVTYSIYGATAWPAALADEKGTRVVLDSVPDARALERLARAVTVEMGAHAGIAMCPMDGAHARRTCVARTLSTARKIGVAILAERGGGGDPVAAVLDVTGGRRLFRGKVVDVERRMAAGFARGRLTLESDLPSGRGRLTVDFQNENLVARHGDEVLAAVPDLITIVDAQTADPVTTEVVRYGMRVEVLVLPPPPQLTTAEALQVLGPQAFGFDFDYRPAVRC